MNFDFSDELNLLREQARKFLTDQCPPKAVRQVLEGQTRFDRTLWQQVADMGWLGAAVPETYGGVELGHEGLCVIAEEMGRVLAPVPFGSQAYLAIEAVLAHGTESQKRRWLPEMVSGKTIAAFALAEGAGNPRAEAIGARLAGGRLTADKWPVADGSVADIAIVVATDDQGTPTLALVELDAAGVQREPVDTLDPSRDQARLRCTDAPAEALGDAPCGWAAIEHLLDQAAVLMAFEQLGGAQAALDMATAYAQERTAFGRLIGSFQAIKHKLADVYIATELARSNCYYGAWALQAQDAALPQAAAAARVAATEAFHQASKENIQTHGGMGFTWEMDCHLYYRRSKLLALMLGSQRFWKDRLVTAWANASANASAEATADTAAA